jgi:excisionase family DNA binding protein
MAVADPLPLFLTVDETADLLRTTRKAIYSMVERGQIPGVTRIGRRVLVRNEDLLRRLNHSGASSPKYS